MSWQMACELAEGGLVSIEIFFLTLIFSLPLGLVICGGVLSRCSFVRVPTQVFISIMRGTPLMLQLFLVYFSPYYLGGMRLAPWYRFTAVIIAFSLNYACYFAEIYRGGILSVSDGQREAARALGLTSLKTFFFVILPQAIRNSLPSITNEVITLVKDTSLAFALSVLEIFTVARMAASANTTLIPFVAVGVFYYVFNCLVAWVMSRAEKAFRLHD